MNIEYSGGDRVGHVAQLVLLNRFDAVQSWLPRAIAPGEGQVEAVHQLRVSSRRAVAVLKLFHEFVPAEEQAALIRELKALRRSAGAARDYDVLLDRFTQLEVFAAKGTLLQLIRERRVAAQMPLQEVYDRLIGDGELVVRFEQAMTAVGDAPSRVARRKFRKWARPALHDVVKSFLRASKAPSDDMEALHQFRIRCKDLRYAIEAVAPALPSDAVRQVLSRLKPLQLRLGQLNDAVSAIARIEPWCQLTEDAKEQVAIEQLLQDARRELDAARDIFTQWWTPKRRRKLRRRVKALFAHST